MFRYGRLLFHDTRDGEVLYIIDQVEGNCCPHDPEVGYKVLEKQFGNRDYINHKQLEWDEHKEDFEKYSYIRVMKNGELLFSTKETKYRIGIKNCMTDRWWPLFEKEYNIFNEETDFFDIDKLQKFYDSFINYNFKNTCKIVPIHWLRPAEIRRFNDCNEELIVNWSDELFPSKEEFAKEIYEDGMIFPMQVKNRDGSYLIFDGSHRLIAAKMLINEGLWKEDKKILALEFVSTNTKFIDSRTMNYTLDNPVTMHIPKALMSKYHFVHIVSQREYDEDIMEIEIDRYIDMVLLFRMYVNELTRSTSVYKKMTGKTFTPAKQINDEKYFYEWLNR